MTLLLATPLLLTALFSPPHPAPATAHSIPQQPASGRGAVWPLSPRPEIVRGFEPPPKPWLAGHRGLDLSGSPGQQVRSATPGKVTYAGALAGRGVIVVTNGPFRTTYEPVIPTVRTGTTVTPGTLLGTLSAAPSHCAPSACLHWGLLQASAYMNPLSLLPQRPIRLLPLTPPPTQPPNPALPMGLAPRLPAQLSPGPAPPTALRSPAVPPTALPSPAAPPTLAPRPGDAVTTASRSGAQATVQAVSTQPSTTRAGASPHGDLASGVFVGLAALATLIGSLLIRRH